MNSQTLRWSARDWRRPTWIIGTDPAQFMDLPPFNVPIWVLFDPIGWNATENPAPQVMLCRAVPGSMGALVTYFEWETAAFIDTNGAWTSIAWCLADHLEKDSNDNSN